MATLGELAASKGGHAAAETPSYKKRCSHIDAFRAHLAGPSCASWFELYRSVCGGLELPMIVIENQGDIGKTNFARAEMTRFTEDMITLIRQRDQELFGNASPPVPPRSIVYGQKKWLLPHTGSLGEREDNKTVSEKYMNALVDHYSATELRRMLTDLKAEKLNRHDVADAFLQSMHRAEDMWVMHAKTQLPRRKKGEFRADPPLLTPDQLGDGGTIRVIGIDPGTTNLGLCHLELVAQQLPPHDSGRPDDKSEPIFSVLDWQLVNLNLTPLEFRYPKSYAVMQLAAPTRIFMPDYSTGDIRTFFQRAAGIVAAHTAHKTELKRRRTEKELGPNKAARTTETVISLLDD